MPDAQTVEGTGISLEEAMKQALENIPPVNGADILFSLQVESFGLRVGGFNGISEFWVKATYTLG